MKNQINRPRQRATRSFENGSMAEPYFAGYEQALKDLELADPAFGNLKKSETLLISKCSKKESLMTDYSFMIRINDEVQKHLEEKAMIELQTEALKEHRKIQIITGVIGVLITLAALMMETPH